MKSRDNKILVSKLNNLVDLLDNHSDIFFEERPFLGDLTLDPEIKLSERRNENEQKIKSIVSKLNEELAEGILEKTQTTEQ